jgi:tryptophan synthase alpha chain
LATISSDCRLGAAWAEARAERRAALIPYLTAGHPDESASREALRAADDLADIIEIGVPFSDPLADGPTIQRSSFAAIASGMTLARTLELVDCAALKRPVVLFSYLNPILRYGLERFLLDAAELGVAGLLLTDLPVGADAVAERAVAASPLSLIRLVAPTTTDARLTKVVDGAEGFIYLIARLGVTGARADLPGGLHTAVGRVRGATPLPVAVGFGISTPAQATEVGAAADGVVVGSALVEAMNRDGARGARNFLSAMHHALRGASRE